MLKKSTPPLYLFPTPPKEHIASVENLEYAGSYRNKKQNSLLNHCSALSLVMAETLEKRPASELALCSACPDCNSQFCSSLSS